MKKIYLFLANLLATAALAVTPVGSTHKTIAENIQATNNAILVSTGSSIGTSSVTVQNLAIQQLTNTACLGTDSVGTVGVGTCSGGGGGSPGGSNTNVQFNNAGSFGGASSFTYISADGSVHLSGGTGLEFSNSGSASSVLSNPLGGSFANLEIQAADGVGVNTDNIFTGGQVDFLVAGASTLNGKFAVFGSSANSSAAYSGFTSTSAIAQSTLWSLPRKDGTNGQAMVTDGAAHLSFATVSGGSTSPAFPLNSVQFNSAGSFAGSNSLKFFGSSLTLNGGTIALDDGGNVLIGDNMGDFINPAIAVHNVGIGLNSLRLVTTGYDNVSVGYLTNERLVSGYENTSIGNGAGDDIISGAANTCIGGGNDANQPCQSILYGSSNTMVGAGTGSTAMDAQSSANTYIGYSAGPGTGMGGLLNYSMCFGANCIVSSSNTARIGGFGAADVVVNFDTGTVSSMTISTLLTVSSFSLTNVRSGTQCIQADSTGHLSGSGSPCTTPVLPPLINNGDQYSVPYYSGPTSSNTLSADSGIFNYQPGAGLTIGGAETNPLTVAGPVGGISAGQVAAGAFLTAGSYIKSGASVGPNYLLNSTGSDFGCLGNTGGNNWSIGDCTSATSFDKTNIKWGPTYTDIFTSMTAQGANGLGVTYNLNVGSMTGAGLSSCSGGTNAVTWNSSTNQFGCNTISGSGGGGGYNLQPTTVTVNANFGITVTTITVSSNTVLTGTTFYANGQAVINGVNSSSWLTGNQTVTLSGDVTGSGATSIVTTAAATQSHITTLSASSTTVAGANGLAVTGATTGPLVTVSSVPTGVLLVSVSSTPAVNPTDFLLNVSSVSGTMILGADNAGNVISSGTVPAVSSCGTSPSMDQGSTNMAGTINTGSASPTACTLTFANGGFVTTPTCVVSDDLQTSEPAITTRSNTGFTLTLSAALNSGHIFYICVGGRGG